MPPLGHEDMSHLLCFLHSRLLASRPFLGAGVSLCLVRSSVDHITFGSAPRARRAYLNYPVSLACRRSVSLRQRQHARLLCQQEKDPSQGDAWLTACRVAASILLLKNNCLSCLTCGASKLVMMRTLLGNVLAALVTAGLLFVQHCLFWYYNSRPAHFAGLEGAWHCS